MPGEEKPEERRESRMRYRKKMERKEIHRNEIYIFFLQLDTMINMVKVRIFLGARSSAVG
jgi:hypothetical protein